MREITFIKQNKEKWMEIEQVIHGKIKKNPDDLSSMYILLTNDLAFARTYYPKSKVTVYLNFLSSRIFQKIYKTRRMEHNRLLYLWKTEVPLLMYYYRAYFYLAFAFFAVFVCIGVSSAIYDEGFTNLILGEGYVNMTKENIRAGNAMAVYGSGSNWGSTIGIVFNNILVGAKLYIYGIFGGIGSLFILLQNSIMLGTFQYFFVEYGVFKESLRGIWLHGTFEIFSMVVEACAGLVLGGSILFPQSYSRLDAFKIGFRDSFKIFFSTLPFTCIAGIIEGYITRYALEMPAIFNTVIIFTCFGIITFYYFVYPFIVKNKIHTTYDSVL